MPCFRSSSAAVPRNVRSCAGASGGVRSSQVTMKLETTLLLLLGVCFASFLLHPGQVEGIQVLRFQEDRKATTETMAWYQGQLDPHRQLHSVTLCGRFYLFTIHGWATFFAIFNSKNDSGILEGDIWVERVRPVIARNWNFQLLKKKIWVFKWHHLCFTYDHTQHLISTYVDGSLNNHQEYDIVRTVSGVKARLGQGMMPRRSFSGDLTQVNVWDRPLSPEEVRSIADCQSDPQGNYVSWEGGWTLQNVTSYNLSLTKLCDRDAGPTYFWFEWSPYLVADYLCLALGSQLPTNHTEATTAINAAKNSSLNLGSCYRDYWLAPNDIEEEGVWKIGNTPVDMSSIGWAAQEPNGLHYENCIAFEYRSSDIDCRTNVKCTACLIQEQQRFSLLGICENELRNIYFTAFQYNVSELIFIGYGAYHIQKVNGIWTWVNHVTNTTIAEMEEFFPDYPMGRRWWKLHQPVCNQKHGGRRLLLLSPCSYDDFTCDDATCIPLHKRCDLKYDCRDNTDELNCKLVAFPEEYQSHLPPRAGGREDKSLPIVLTIDVDFLSVRTMDMVMDLSYELALTWVDNRLRYQNLKVNNTLNILPDDTMHKLWSPQVSFVNTNGNQHTLMDTDTTMLVDRYGNAISRDPAAPAEVDIFSGETNTVTAKRKYGTVYMCDLDLVLYPFDVQECYLHLRITSATKSFLLFDVLKSFVNISANKLLLEYEASHHACTITEA
nr:uncharacterized protein LOC123746084 [Procambarus clarkii]